MYLFLRFIKPAFLCTETVFKLELPIFQVDNVLEPKTEFFLVNRLILVGCITTDSDERFVVFGQIIADSALDFVIVGIRIIFNPAKLALSVEIKFRVKFVGYRDRVET